MRRGRLARRQHPGPALLHNKAEGRATKGRAPLTGTSMAARLCSASPSAAGGRLPEPGSASLSAAPPSPDRADTCRRQAAAAGAGRCASVRQQPRWPHRLAAHTAGCQRVGRQQAGHCRAHARAHSCLPSWSNWQTSTQHTALTLGLPGGEVATPWARDGADGRRAPCSGAGPRAGRAAWALHRAPPEAGWPTAGARDCAASSWRLRSRSGVLAPCCAGDTIARPAPLASPRCRCCRVNEPAGAGAAVPASGPVAAAAAGGAFSPAPAASVWVPADACTAARRAAPAGRAGAANRATAPGSESEPRGPRRPAGGSSGGGKRSGTCAPGAPAARVVGEGAGSP